MKDGRRKATRLRDSARSAAVALALLLLSGHASAQQNAVVAVATTSAAADLPSTTVTQAVPGKVIGGGALAHYNGFGVLLTSTAPGTPGRGTTAWTAAAKDHLVADPGTVTAYSMTLSDPADLWDVGVFAATSALASHPLATAKLPAGWVLASGGCTVNWSTGPGAAGNLLTASFPSSPTTWECRSKDHSAGSPATITAYVVGIRPKRPDVPLPQMMITTATSGVASHPDAVAAAVKGWTLTGGGALALPAVATGAGQLLTGSYPDVVGGAPVWHAASKDHAVASPGTVQAFAISIDFKPSSRPGPLNVLAVGDSVMWGQGLVDAHKFPNLVQGHLSQSFSGLGANLVSLAHSGAKLVPVDPTQEGTAPTPGEIPNHYPTVKYQALHIGPTVVDPMNIDLVLLDGCANDINIMTVLNPTLADASLAQMASDLCYGPMYQTLFLVHGTYPNAKIAVTGYYPFASAQSDFSSIVVAASTAFGLAPAIFGLAGIPIPTDPVTGLVLGAAAAGAYGPIVTSHSQTFLTGTSNALGSAVQNFNAAVGGHIAIFSVPNFQPQNSYAAPQSYLWLLPMPRSLNIPNGTDEVYEARQGICKTINFPSLPDASAVDPVECPFASVGHPNALGAQAYADAIVANIAGYLPEWRAVHEYRALTVTATPSAVDADTPQTVVVGAVATATGQPLPAVGEVWIGGSRVAFLNQPFTFTAPSFPVASVCAIDPVTHARTCAPAHKAANPVTIEVRGVPGYANGTFNLGVNVASLIQ